MPELACYWRLLPFSSNALPVDQLLRLRADGTRIYVHYDGQPVNPSGWKRPPFEPTLYTAAMDKSGRRVSSLSFDRPEQ